MAWIEEYWRCLCCKKLCGTQAEAIACAASHTEKEFWAVGESGKGVRISPNAAPGSRGSRECALQEAELSDDIEERARQIAQLKVTDFRSKTINP